MTTRFKIIIGVVLGVMTGSVTPIPQFSVQQAQQSAKPAKTTEQFGRAYVAVGDLTDQASTVQILSLCNRHPSSLPFLANYFNPESDKEDFIKYWKVALGKNPDLGMSLLDKLPQQMKLEIAKANIASIPVSQYIIDNFPGIIPELPPIERQLITIAALSDNDRKNSRWNQLLNQLPTMADREKLFGGMLAYDTSFSLQFAKANLTGGDHEAGSKVLELMANRGSVTPETIELLNNFPEIPTDTWDRLAQAHLKNIKQFGEPNELPEFLNALPPEVAPRWAEVLEKMSHSQK